MVLLRNNFYEPILGEDHHEKGPLPNSLTRFTRMRRTIACVAIWTAVFMIFVYATLTFSSKSNSLLSPSNKVTEAAIPISYNLEVPIVDGCPETVSRLQSLLIEKYSQELKGIRYVNSWGYLDDENKGDSAIWAAQNMLLTHLGISQMEVSTHFDGINLTDFNAALAKHPNESAIIITGGGDFNDIYWSMQPSRLRMIQHYHHIPIRSFPLSMHFSESERAQKTISTFQAHPDVHLAARDGKSFEWLRSKFGKESDKPGLVEHVLTPDIVFMWGNRSEIRRKTKQTHDILFLMREDGEHIHQTLELKNGEGQLSNSDGSDSLTYRKVDWNNLQTPNIDQVWDRMQRQHAKAMYGFELLASSRFVITDRLHGHIMATILGLPHVLLPSGLGKGLALHDTWTQDCRAVRAVTNMTTAIEVARRYFDSL